MTSPPGTTQIEINYNHSLIFRMLKNRIMGLDIQNMICVPNTKAVDVIKLSRKYQETHDKIISWFNRHHSQILNRQMLVKYTVL